MLAAILGLSSCVKNEVSDEVKLIRQAQIAKLNADVSKILAQVQTIEIQNAFDEAYNAFMLDQTEANLIETMARVEYYAALYLRQQQEQELQYAQALAAYERFISQGQFQQNISDLLGKYNNENQVLMQLYHDRITLTRQIANGQLLLATGSSLTWDQVKAYYEADLDKKNAELDAANEALPLLENALEDPATIESELIDTYIQLSDLEDQWDSINIAYTNAYNEWDVANNKAGLAGEIIGAMEDYMDDLDGFNTDLEDITADIADATAALTPLNTTLTLTKATLTSKIGSLTAATTAYNAKLTAYNTANTNNNNAINNVSAKLYLWQIAQNNLAADPTNAALIAAEDAAHTAYDDAVTAQGITQTALNEATIARDNAKATMDAAQADVDIAQAAVDAAQTAVDNQMDDIAGLNEDKTEIENDIVIVTGKIEAWQDDYDESVANIDQYIIDAALLNEALIFVEIEAWKIETMIVQLDDVIDVLENRYEDIAMAIDELKEIIEDLEYDVAALEEMIAKNVIDKTYAEGEVERLQALLAITEVKITEGEAIVAHWKAMLDEAIAAAAN